LEQKWKGSVEEAEERNKKIDELSIERELV
jgi:hypothetical protein